MFAINRSFSTPNAHLNAVLERRSAARSTRFSEVPEAPGRGQEGGGLRGPSQNYVSGADSAKDSSPAATSQPASTTSTSPEREAPAAEHRGISKLRETFQALGMNTSQLQISYSEENVWYPGGSYTNKLIRVQSGDKVENFSADLTEKNPYVTAYEMQRYFGVQPGTSYRG